MNEIFAHLARSIFVDPMEVLKKQGEQQKHQSAPSTRQSDENWDYWAKIYEDPEMRQQIAQKAQNGPSMSDLLSSSSLSAAELIFLNVPRLSNKQQAVVRSLIAAVAGRHVPILDVVVEQNTWSVHFYRITDAELVHNKLDGYSFRGRTLIVRFSEKVEEKKDVDDNAPTKEVSTLATPIPMARAQTDEILLIDGWTPLESKELIKCRNQLVTLLTLNPYGVEVSFALAALRIVFPTGVVRRALEEWPTAVLRLCTPRVRVYGRYCTLAEQNNHEHLTKVASTEGLSRDTVDQWEPMAPSNIRNEYHLVDYMVEFLKHFGPQHTKVDLPLRMLSRCLSGSLPSSATSLASLLQTLSPHFVVFDDVLYLGTYVKHRRAILEMLKPIKPRHFAPTNGTITEDSY